MLSRNHFGGILLYGQNFVDAEQTLRLISDYQTTNQTGGGLPLIVFADQEGGNVNRIPYGIQGVSNMALGATGETENARATAAMLAEEMRLLGILADFAPVVDVNNNALNPIIGIRSFSDNPETVAQFGKAYIQGLHDAGIISTATVAALHVMWLWNDFQISIILLQKDKVRTLYPYAAARLPFMIFLAYHKPINEQIARKFVAPLFDGENVW